VKRIIFLNFDEATATRLYQKPVIPRLTLDPLKKGIAGQARNDRFIKNNLQLINYFMNFYPIQSKYFIKYVFKYKFF